MQGRRKGRRPRRLRSVETWIKLSGDFVQDVAQHGAVTGLVFRFQRFPAWSWSALDKDLIGHLRGVCPFQPDAG